jgi:hypothetical protein
LSPSSQGCCGGNSGFELQEMEDEAVQADNFGLFQKPKSHGPDMNGVWGLGFCALIQEDNVL